MRETQNSSNMLSAVRRSLMSVVLLFTLLAVKAQLTVSSQSNLQQLAQAITGNGVTISNPSISCNALGFGEYSYTGTDMSITEGVVLTSGRITDVLGPNDAGNTTFQANTSGNSLLNNVTGRTTYDACKFEFDIIPTGDSLRFDFSFASEEYNEWVGSQFNDVFGFFISGPGVAGDAGAGSNHNIALVPTTNTPVTINNVNNGSNSSYYIDNTGGSETQYDGYTTGLFALALVQPCQTYHLQLIVADASDRKFDSGVFIEKINSPTVTMSSYTQNGTPHMVEGCNPGWVRFDRGAPRPSALTLQYYLDGTAINGTDYTAIGNVNNNVAKSITIPANAGFVDRPVNPIFDNISEGTEYLRFRLGNPNCPSIPLDTLIFDIVDSVFATCTPNGTICRNDSLQFVITGGSNFSWTPATGLSCTNCPNPWARPTVTTNYQVTVADGTCSRVFNRQVKVSNLTLSAVVTNPLCNGNTNGAINLTVSSGIAPYTYAWTGPNGFTASTQDITTLAAGTYTVIVTDAACTRTQSWNVIEPAALAVTLTPSILAFGQNIRCHGGNDGTISSVINGGTAPYILSWSGPNGFSSSNTNISGLYAGSYTLTVTDAHGCQTSATQALVEAAQLSASISGISNVLCFGDGLGGATVNGSGGMPPYSFTWNTSPVQSTASATSLAAGNYIATVTDAYNCTATANAIIGGPVSGLSTTVTTLTHVKCRGASTGVAAISTAGGTAPYSISWNTVPVQNGATASNLPAGTWTATVTDANGCQTTRAITITEPASVLSASLFSQTDVLCFGNTTGSATVSASGGTGPYTYQWNTTPVQNGATANNLAAGAYTCTVRDVNNCSTTLNVTITQPAATLSASISAQTNVLCFGNSTGSATVSANGGTAPYAYSWNSTPSQNTATASNLIAGSYTCTITDANGCSITRNVTITQPAATLSASISAQTNVLCFGNSTGSATVSVSGGTSPYSYSWNTTPIQNTATAAGLVAGNYTCTITDANGCSITRNVTITQPVTTLNAAVSAQTNVLCFGNSTGSATVSASGGTAPYSYSWNTNPIQNTASATGLVAGNYTCTITDANGCSTTENVVITQPAATLSASISAQTNLLCFGNNTGSATVSANGGTAPYTYSWNTTPAQNTSSATGLIAGSYTCTITDANGCSITRNVTITQPAAVLSTSISAQTNVLCFGNSTGSATVSASGGTAPYSYSWNTTPIQNTASATGLIAGGYVCTITDANGCGTTANVTITQPAAALSASISAQTNVLCFGNNTGSATVSATGGTAPYSYAWNTTPAQNAATATGLVAGNYTCSITDANGCSTTANVTITQPTATLSTSISAQTNVLCFGNSTGSATVSASGGTAPYTYSWNSTPSQNTATASNLIAGSYTCTITDANGCSITRNVTITQPAATLSASISAQTNVLCFGNSTGSATVSVSGGTSPYSYSWNTTPIQNTATAAGLVAGNYTCTITDANGCSITRNVTITQPVTTLNAAVSAQTNVLCFGNSTGSATVSASGGTAPYSYSWNTNPIQNTASATGLVAGNYTCTITDANGCSTTENVVITQPAATLSASISAQTNLLCFGNNTGSATVSANGGTAPYTYSWNTTPAQNTSSATGLIAGSYTCTITDANGCSITRNVTITQPAAALAITGVVTPATCGGAATGAVNATVTGGTGTYSFAWSGPGVFTAITEDISALTSGVYSLTVTDANGCSTSSSFNVGQPGLFSVNGTVSNYTGGWNVSCPGGSNGAIDMTVSGGTTPYTHAWSGPNGYTSASLDLTGLQAGAYTYVLTDANGCSVSASFNLTQPSPVVLSTNTVQPITCNGDANAALSVSASGGTAPLTYAWSGPGGYTAATASINGLAPGTYSLVVTDANGCTDGGTNDWTFADPAVLTPGASVTTNVSCFGAADGSGTANVTGGIAPYSIIWNTTPVQSGATASGLNAGSYTVTVTDARGCIRGQSITITQPAAALSASIGAQTDVLCFGNSTGSATANVSGGTAPYSYAWNTTPVQNTATASGLTAGAYACIITDAHGCSTTVNTSITQPVAALSASISSSTNVLCFGNSTGSATVSVSGGTPGYSYSWNSIPVQSTATAGNLPAGTFACTITDANGCSLTRNVTITQPAAALSVSLASQVNVGCFGNATGSASVSASGGTPAYNYSWNTTPVQNSATATGLVAGNYTCTITDINGCSASQNVTITQPSAALSANITAQTNVLIFGQSTGSATATASNGTAPYAYAWSNGQTNATATGLAAGSYSVTVTDANGCIVLVNVTITQPGSALSASISAQTNVLCFGNSTGNATVTAAGGTAPYSYSWNTVPVQSTATANGLSAGPYTCTVTDVNGAMTSVSVTIAQPAVALSATTATHADVLCFGNSTGSASVNATGGTPGYSFTWNTVPVQTGASAGGLIAGTYTCSIIDANGCSTSQNVTIDQPASALSVSISSQTNVGCFGNSTGSATATAIGGTAPYSFDWNSPVPQNNATATNLAAGNYTCTVTDANGCVTSVNVTITQPAAGLSASIASTTQATCGQSNGTASIAVNGGTAPYGYSWNSTPAQVTATLTGVTAGAYTCTVTDANGCIASASATITSPSGLSIAIVSTTAQTCFGTANGQGTVAASGGTAPYNYHWNTVPAQNAATASALVAGTYTATVTDANGCSANVNVSIIGPASALTINVDNVTNVLCYDANSGSATVSAHGGLAPYSYTWNTAPVQTGPTAVNLTAGTWTVTTNDAFGCATSINIPITQPVIGISAFVEEMGNVSCHGGNNGYATFEVSGGSGSYSMQWNTVPPQFGATAVGLTAGVWTISINDLNGCDTQKDFFVTIGQPAAPLSLSTLVSDHNGFAISCSGGSDGTIDLTTSGGTPPYAFNWSGPNGFTSTTQDLTGLTAGNYTLTVTDAKGCSASWSTTLSAPPAITSSGNVTTAACFGASNGAVDVTLAGGVAPYSLFWTGANAFTSNSEDITGVPAGVYVLNGSDANGCPLHFYYDVNEPGLFTVTGTLSNHVGGNQISCSTSIDGAIDVTATGGTQPYTYQWIGPNGFTSNLEDLQTLSAGAYNLTLTDANGCSALAQYTLNAPAPLYNTLAPTTYPSGGNVSCDGAVDGAIDASIGGGTPNYTVLWTGPNGFSAATEDLSGLLPGTYTMVVTDANGCTATQQTTLTSPAQVNASLTVSHYNSGDAVSCNGGNTGMIDITITGGIAPYSVTWNGPNGFNSSSPDLSGLFAGTYIASVVDAAGCDTTLMVTLTEPTPITTSGVTSSFNGYEVGCANAYDGSIDLTANGGAGNYTYQWTGPNAFVNTAQDVSGLAAGVYNVSVVDMNGCASALSFTLHAPPSILATADITTATCQGSNTGALDLSINGGVAPYTIAWTGPGGFTANSEDLNTLFAGTYVATVVDANGCTTVQNYDVSEPGVFNISASLTTYPGGYGVSCAGESDGAIDLTATGGTAPLYFAWSGPNGFAAINEDIDSLSAGNYQLLLTDANGCTQLEDWTLTTPSAVNVGLIASQYFGGANVACMGSSDGSIDAVIVGGVSPYTVQWTGPNAFQSINEDITGLSSGTYQVNVVDAIGCPASADLTLTEPTPIDVQLSLSQYISGGNVSCSGETDGSIDVDLSGGSLLYFINWTGPNGFVSNNEDLSGLAAGQYNVTVTDANGCPTMASANLIAPQPIVIDLNVIPHGGGFAVSCNGDTTGVIDATVQGGAAPLTYQWSGPNGFTSSNVDLSGVGAGTYDLLVTDAAGCTGTASVTLNEPSGVNSLSTLSDAGNGYQLSCASNDGSIAITAAGGQTPYLFDWSGPNGFASLDQNITDLAAGEYVLTLIDANGCTSVDTFLLAAPTPLSASLAVGGNICDGTDDGSIDLQLTGGVAPYNYSWSGPDGFTASTEDVSALPSGTYTVNVNDAGTCSGTWNATIIASSHMDLQVYVSDYGNFNIPCSGDSTGVIEATLTGGEPQLSIIWNGPNGFTSNDTHLSGLVAGDYQLHIVDGNGCALDSSITLTAPASPIAASLTPALYAGGFNVACHGGNNGAIATDITGGTAPYEVVWHGGNDSSYVGEDVTGLTAGLYDVVVTDTNQCSFTTNITLTEPPALSADVTTSEHNGFNTSCANSNDASIQAAVSGGTPGLTIQWTGPNGFTSNAGELNDLAPGTYYFSLSDANDCALLDTITLTAPGAVDPVLTAGTFPSGSNISCAGANDATVAVDMQGGAGAFTVQWTGPNGFSSSDTSLSGLGAGSYCVTVTDANNCTGQECIALIEPQALAVNAEASTAACGGNTGSVDATPSGGSQPYAFLWSNNAVSEDIVNVAPNTYVITVTDVNGCSASASAQVIASPGVTATVNVDSVNCNGGTDGSIDLTVTAGTAPYTFVWTGGSNTEDISGLPAGGYTLLITDANGCTWNDLIIIGEPAPLTATSVTSEYANGHNVSGYGAQDGSIELTVEGGTPGYGFNWNNGTSNSTAHGLTAGSYAVTITDANGCKLDLSFELDQPTDLAMPTGFTPNGDGSNDAFVIHGIEGYRSNQLVVFNRWGNVVYDQLNYKNTWRGENQQGEPLPNGTYFVILRLNDGGLTLQNYVDLRR